MVVNIGVAVADDPRASPASASYWPQVLFFSGIAPFCNKQYKVVIVNSLCLHHFTNLSTNNRNTNIITKKNKLMGQDAQVAKTPMGILPHMYNVYMNAFTAIQGVVNRNLTEGTNN